MTSRDILKVLRKDGWYIVDQDGSHAQLKHPTKPGKVTVPIHGSKDIPPGTLNSILKQAGLK
ncbi:type II toxin-antitoxin system HicA family toxin [Butyribacter intestini]|jgi:predicted RNA binding protein YcfA (HicA-like mRNA interferase family)|uniref:type II toxin-antitoxin system HicA family toxin n=1 Tax=Butyribacter intestini TaxID=1703332 RepID=UPI003AF042B9